MIEHRYVSPEALDSELVRGYQVLLNAEIGGGLGLIEAVTEAGARETMVRYGSAPDHLLVALDGREVVGSGMLHIRRSPVQDHVAELRKLVVHPDHRRRGIGRSIVRHLVDHARALGLWTLLADVRSHLPSRQLLGQEGFVEVGVFEDLSRVGDTFFDIVLLQKMLQRRDR